MNQDVNKWCEKVFKEFKTLGLEEAHFTSSSYGYSIEHKKK